MILEYDWSLEVPLKIQNFAWFASLGILQKRTKAFKNWESPCLENFLTVGWKLWNRRNEVCMGAAMSLPNITASSAVQLAMSSIEQNQQEIHFNPVPFKWKPLDTSCFKLYAAGLNFRDVTEGVGAVICDSAGKVFAALSGRVCDSQTPS